MSLWDQHRERYERGGVTVRRITYLDFQRITAGAMTIEDMAALGRLNAKRESGAELTAEENQRLVEIAGKWPVAELKAQCFVPPVTPEEADRILGDMTHRDALYIESCLDRCISPDIPEADITDPLAIVLVASGGLGIDIADMTVGQGMAVVAMLTPKTEGSE